jgi:NADPH-dependent 2,4-dienoyl-CoA reductase/sulfur reductase-like enzyme
LLEDGVLCDQHLLAHGSASIYAVGDVCHYYDPAGSSYRRGENWTNAVEQAAVVATNLVSRGAATYAGLDYLWTHQCGRRIQAMGDLQSGEPEISARGPGHPDSWVLRTKDTEGVRGALAVNWPAAIAESRQLLVQRALKTHAAHQA